MNGDTNEEPQRPSQAIDLTPTGIPALDENLGGGLPRGSLVLLGGAPGTGKTILASHFLYEGARKYGENGVYASFSESKGTFMELMKRFGYDFDALEREGRCSYLDFVTAKGEAISTILTQTVEEIHRIQAKRLVIDSFTAIAAGISDRVTVRMALQNILSRITRSAECTTLLIKERPGETESTRTGMEEFVADAVFILKRTEYDERRLRLLEIWKSRGQKTSFPRMLFTLGNGFEAHSPLKEFSASPSTLEWKTIPDRGGKLSTGHPDLDNLLGGGYDSGSHVLIEIGENVPQTIRKILTFPTMLNFISQSRGVTVIPEPDISAHETRAALAKHIDEEKVKSLLRVYERIPSVTDTEVSAPAGGLDPYEDYQLYVKSWKELKERTEERPVLRLSSMDTLEYAYGLKGLLGLTADSITRSAIYGDLTIGVVASQLECTKHLMQLVKTHLRIRERLGSILIYGMKPRTEILIAEIDSTRGIPELRLHAVN